MHGEIHVPALFYIPRLENHNLPLIQCRYEIKQDRRELGEHKKL